MKVSELVARLQMLDPDADVRFHHLRKVKDDGTGQSRFAQGYRGEQRRPRRGHPVGLPDRGRLPLSGPTH